MCSDTALAAMSSVDANGGSVDVPEGPINPDAQFLVQLSDPPWGVQAESESWDQNVLLRGSDLV